MESKNVFIEKRKKPNCQKKLIMVYRLSGNRKNIGAMKTGPFLQSNRELDTIGHSSVS